MRTGLIVFRKSVEQLPVWINRKSGRFQQQIERPNSRDSMCPASVSPDCRLLVQRFNQPMCQIIYNHLFLSTVLFLICNDKDRRCRGDMGSRFLFKEPITSYAGGLKIDSKKNHHCRVGVVGCIASTNSRSIVSVLS